MEDNKDYGYDGKLYKITEPEIIEQIQVMINSSSYNILSAISLVQKYYGDKYPNMKYSDWSNLVKSIKKTNTKENQKENIVNKQLTVKQIIVKILRERGGEASYSDIYEDFENFTGKNITTGQKAGIRATIERASSDSSQFSGKDDLFYSCNGKGNGWWGLREISPDYTDNIKSQLSDDLVLKKNYDFVTSIFDFLFSNKLITKEIILFLCSKERTDKAMGVACPNPILLEIKKNQDINSQIVISGQKRYYTDPIYEFEGNKYVVSSQWYGPETTKKDTKTPFVRMIKKIINEEM